MKPEPNDLERFELAKAIHYMTTYMSVVDYQDLILPFGKYQGQPLHEIPLHYLDETIAVMPPTFLVRAVRAYVNAIATGRETTDYYQQNGRLPNKPYGKLEK